MKFVVKVWDSTFDSSTRNTHAELEGQIRELDEKFTCSGGSASYPGGFGDPAEDCNCRCCLLQRARRAVKGEKNYQKWNNETGEFIECSGYEEFKEKYLKAADKVDKTPKSDIISQTRENLKAAKVEYRAVKPLEKALSESAIIERIGGEDLTEGSCASLALAYAGNKNKLDVLDFRGGISRSTFSGNSAINEIAGLPEVKGTVLKEFNDFTAANKLLKTAESGKEYLLGVGKHAAIVRKAERGFEYLELQFSTNNGFKKLTTGALKRRFGCQKSHTLGGCKLEMSSTLVECESLGNSDEVKKLLGYINTSKTSQMKGVEEIVK